MERVTWTDERLDDLTRRVDLGFERVDHDIRDLRTEIASMRTTMIRIGGGIIVGLVGVIAAVLVSGG